MNQIARTKKLTHYPTYMPCYQATWIFKDIIESMVLSMET
jgi:hypothetical protein